MLPSQYEYYINWIAADHTPFLYNNYPYFMKTASREARFLAERVYFSIYEEAIDEGLFSPEEISNLLFKYKVWSNEKEEQLTKLTKDTEEIKIKMWQSYTKSSEIIQLKKVLKITNDYIGDLLNDKQTFDQFGAISTAQFAKQHFLIGSSIYKAKNKPLWKHGLDLSYMKMCDNYINAAYKELNKYFLKDKDYRELAKSPSWRSIWSSRKSVGSLFGRAIVDFSPQQKQLVMWSNMYDGIYKSNEPPPDFVVNDDDILDGWLLSRQRKYEAEINKNLIYGMVPDKMSNYEEVYVVCNPEDSMKVVEANDIEGRIALRKRMMQIERDKIVPEQAMIDRLEQVRKQAFQ